MSSEKPTSDKDDFPRISIDKSRLKRLLDDTNVDVFSTTLLSAAMIAFTDRQENTISWLDWDPTTIAVEWATHFGEALSEVHYNKLMAGVFVIRNNALYDDVTDFNRAAVALRYGVIYPHEIVLADVETAAWAFAEGLLIWPPDSVESPVSRDIAEYISLCLHNEGYVIPPVSLLWFASPSVFEDMTFRFSTDPIMYQSVYKVQVSKAQEVDRWVLGRLEQLAQQADSCFSYSDGSNRLSQACRDLAASFRSASKALSLPSS